MIVLTAESEAQPAAGALRAAAKILDRMRRIGNTPVNELTDRQHQEYTKFLSYGNDTARWLRDLADRTTQIQIPREYSIAWRYRGGAEWRLPKEGERTWGDADRAHHVLEDMWKDHRQSSTVEEFKVVRRTKAGPWEDEEA